MDGTHKYIISEEYGFVYHEIQKCATRSMLNYFVFHPAKDYGARRVIGAKNLSDVDGYYHFSFIRNPLHRLVSAYISKFVVYNQHPTKPGIRHKDLYMNMPFEEFVRFVCDTPDEIADVHFKSQYRFLTDGCRIGMVETMNQSFEILMSEIGINTTPSTLLKTNHTDSREWIKYYTSDLLDMVMRRYRTDIELFDQLNNQGFTMTYKSR